MFILPSDFLFSFHIFWAIHLPFTRLVSNSKPADHLCGLTLLAQSFRQFVTKARVDIPWQARSLSFLWTGQHGPKWSKTITLEKPISIPRPADLDQKSTYRNTSCFEVSGANTLRPKIRMSRNGESRGSNKRKNGLGITTIGRHISKTFRKSPTTLVHLAV